MKKIIFVFMLIFTSFTFASCGDNNLLEASDLFERLESYDKINDKMVSPVSDNYFANFSKDSSKIEALKYNWKKPTPDNMMMEHEEMFLHRRSDLTYNINYKLYKDEMIDGNYTNAFFNDFTFYLKPNNKRLDKQLTEGIHYLEFRLSLGTILNFYKYEIEERSYSGSFTYNFEPLIMQMYIDDILVESVALNKDKIVETEGEFINRVNVSYSVNSYDFSFGDYKNPKWTINKKTKKIRFVIIRPDEEKFLTEYKKYNDEYSSKYPKYYRAKGFRRYNKEKETFERLFFEKAYHTISLKDLGQVVLPRSLRDTPDPIIFNTAYGERLYISNFLAVSGIEKQE